MAQAKTETRTKLNSEILSIRELKMVRGKLGECRDLTGFDGQPLHSKKFGSVLQVFELSDLKTGEVNTYWLDGGLRGAFKMGKVTPGMELEIVHTGEKKIEEGTVQTYDIFSI